MRIQCFIVTAALSAALTPALTAAPFWASPAGAQIVDFGKYPDFSGQWKRPEGVGIQWTSPSGLVVRSSATDSGVIRPVTRPSLADQALGGQGDDTTGQCYAWHAPGHDHRLSDGIHHHAEDHVHSDRLIRFPDASLPMDGTGPRRWNRPSWTLSIGTWIDPDANGRYSTLEVETRGFKESPHL